MAERQLSPEEAAIWARVAATVHPLDPKRKRAAPQPAASPAPSPKPVSLPPHPAAVPPARAVDTLDGGWDRRLRRGMVQPERTIDLHGHTLASAYAALERALDGAVADGVRILLLVTGKPPKGEAPHRRGLIRASIGDWLAGSRHAARIAAVRNAHPRHGGAGALYVILRRARSG